MLVPLEGFVCMFVCLFVFQGRTQKYLYVTLICKLQSLICYVKFSRSQYCLWEFLDLSEGKMEVREDTIAFKCAWWKLTSSHPSEWAYDINFIFGTKIKWCCQCHCSVYNNICDDLNTALLQLAWEQALFFCVGFTKLGYVLFQKECEGRSMVLGGSQSKLRIFQMLFCQKCINAYSHSPTLKFSRVRA